MKPLNKMSKKELKYLIKLAKRETRAWEKFLEEVCAKLDLITKPRTSRGTKKSRRL